MEHLSANPAAPDSAYSSPWHMSKKGDCCGCYRDKCVLKVSFAADSFRDEDEEEEDEVASVIDLSHISMEYQKLVPLVAMCLAGFPKDEVCVTNPIPGSPGRKNKRSEKSKGSKEAPPSQSLWPSMCKHLVSQLRLVTERPSVGYLIGACEFLLCLLTKGSASPKVTGKPTFSSAAVLQYASVLYSKDLAIEDRCGFACTYLSPSDLVPYLKSVQTACLADCDIEGVILMGLSSSPQAPVSDGGASPDLNGALGGLQLLQKYLDYRYAASF